MKQENLDEAKKELQNEMESDRNFSLKFHEFLKSYQSKKDDKILEEYHNIEKVGFSRFLYEFSINRNIKSDLDSRKKIIEILVGGIFNGSNIDNLAKAIQKKELTVKRKSGNHDLPISLTSKVFFLYRPDNFVPYDSYVIKA